MSDSLQPHGLQPTRLLCPWDFLGKSTGVGCHCLLRLWHEISLIASCELLVVMCGIYFPDQEWNPGSPALLWVCRVLATEPPGKSLILCYFLNDICGLSCLQREDWKKSQHGSSDDLWLWLHLFVMTTWPLRRNFVISSFSWSVFDNLKIFSGLHMSSTWKAIYSEKH